MHKAKFWQKGSCVLCPQNCHIATGKSGFCKARKNISGELVTQVYGKPVAVNVDPIEKKPLYHFLPGSKSFSIGTVGCNLACEHCQNFDMSCADPERINVNYLSPEEIVQMAIDRGCKSISYTYNEPTIFFEYAVDCAKLARKKGMKNVIVTNGFINPEPAAEFAKYMDAANVDLKAFNDDFYKKIAKGRLKPVLDTLKLYHSKIWVEVTNLIIDGKNDDMSEIEDMCKWLAKHLRRDVPLHFSRAFPMHRMQDILPTPESTLGKAKEIAEKYLDYVYIGNTGLRSDTLCPRCKSVMIERGNTVRIVKDKCCEVLPGQIST